MSKTLILLLLIRDFQTVTSTSSESLTQEECEFLKNECHGCQGICNGDKSHRVDCSIYCKCTHSELDRNRTNQCTVICKEGYFGTRCEHICSDTCRKGKCSSKDGSCLTGCVIGYHGDTCINRCNRKCRHNICNQETGECNVNCEDGYFGHECERECPVNCDVCSLVNNTLVCLKVSNGLSQKDQCFLYEIILSFLGALVGLLILIYLLYRCNKCSCECQHCHNQEAQVDSPLNLSQFALESHTPSKIVHRLSRSTGYLGETYQEISSYTPTRTRMTLRTFRFPSTSRRSKSLCSLGNGQSCWVGQGEDIFELFNNSPKMDDYNVTGFEQDNVIKMDDFSVQQNDDMKLVGRHDAKHPKAYDVQTCKSHDVKVPQNDDFKGRQCYSVQFPKTVHVYDPQIEDDVFVDAPIDAEACSGFMTEHDPPLQETVLRCPRSPWRSEARKGYISAVYQTDLMTDE